MAESQKQGLCLQLKTALQIHQTITQEGCSQHITCEECTCANPEGPICGILYAKEIKETRKLILAFPKTFEDYYFF